MRVFVITQDEPVYAPVYLAKIIQPFDKLRTPQVNHSVVGITALSPAGKKGGLSFAKQRLAMYGLWDFLRAASLFGYGRLRSLWPVTKKQGSRLYSVAQLAAYHSIPLYPCSNVNTSAYISTLKDLDLDILLSVAAPQRFGRKLLRIPRLACLNVHSSLLPKYRGLDGLFWALVHGESQVGVTVHLMSDGFDDGAIVGQQPFEVAPDDTLHTLYFKAMDVGAMLLSKALDQFAAGTVVTKPNDIKSGSYFAWPTREAARQFRKNGRRFF